MPQPPPEKLDEQVNVKLPKQLLDDLRAIEKKHELAPAALLRRLGQEAAKYFREHGSFTFPVLLQPTEQPASEIEKRLRLLEDKIRKLGKSRGGEAA